MDLLDSSVSQNPTQNHGLTIFKKRKKEAPSDIHAFLYTSHFDAFHIWLALAVIGKAYITFT